MSNDAPGLSTPSPALARLLADARRIGATMPARADEIERERRLPMDLVEALRAAGLFHAGLPANLGGTGDEPLAATRVVKRCRPLTGRPGGAS